MKLLRERLSNRVKQSTSIYALSQRNILPKRSCLPSVAHLDIWSLNAFTHPTRKRIGRVKYSPKRIWIMEKQCVNMHRKHEIA